MSSKFRFLLSPRFLFFYAVIALVVPNVALCFTEHMPFLACLVNIFLPLSAYTMLMSLSRKTGRQVWMLFPLVFFAAFQMVLIYLYGNGVIAVDMFLNLVTTNPGEAMELLDNLVPAVAGVVILYLPLLVIAAVQWAKHVSIDDRGCRAPARHNSHNSHNSHNNQRFLFRARRWSLYGVGVFAVITAVCYFCYPKGNEAKGRFEYHVEDNMYPANVFYNLYLAVRESYRSAHYKENVANFRFNARPTHAKDSTEVYVLVIGETARSENFQLYGYRRPTNPELMQTSGLMVFRDVRSQSNTTHKSVPMLLSAATAEDHDRLYHEKGILAAFHEAGFYTVFLSNQQPNHSYIDFLGEEANEHLFIRNGGLPSAAQPSAQSSSTSSSATLYSDERLLPFLDRVLSENHKKLFVVLHMYGSHFNYRDRYPQSRARFLPDTPTEAKAENRPQLLNAYDNTILQTDHILAAVISRLRKGHHAAALLYTSDHGENIFDDSRRLFLHASPRPSQYDTDVPLLVWTSPEYAAQHASVVSGMKRNIKKGVQSNASVFPTMLSIAGIEAKARVDSLSLTNPAYRLGTRHYLDDHNHAVPLSMYGIGNATH